MATDKQIYDTLLYINSADQDSDFLKRRWNYDGDTAARLGQSVLISYSFLEAPPAYYSASTAQANTFQPLTTQQREVVRGVLNAISSLIGVTFFEVGVVTNGATSGALTFGCCDTGGPPYTDFDDPGAESIRRSSADCVSDIWFGTDWGADGPKPGTIDYLNIWHEIGHALGLRHPGNYKNQMPVFTNTLPSSEDNHTNTVMSYNHSPADPVWDGLFGDGGCGKTQVDDEPTSYLTYDLKALTYLYGPSVNGDTSKIPVVIGGTGNETLTGSALDDLIRGGAGRDTLYGRAGNDVLYGGLDDDKLYGEAGNDILDGGVGNNILDGGAGNDTLTAGWDFDTFVFSTALNTTNNVDTITGFSAHQDRICLSSAIFSALPHPTSSDTRLQAGNFRASANAAAADADDYILLDTRTGELYYDADGNGAGAAVKFAILSNVTANTTYMIGILYDSFFIDTTPTVTISGTNGDDSFDVWVGAMGLTCDYIVNGFAGNDEIVGGPYNDTLNGGDGNDFLHGEAGDDSLIGGAGDDFLYGYEGNDFLDGGDGDDKLQGDSLGIAGDGADKLYGGAGNDTLWGCNLDDYLDGGPGDDILYGDDQGPYTPTAPGNDKLYGGDGNDKLYGDAGNDELHGGNDNDMLSGGVGYDTLYGDAGDDKLYGNVGGDKLYGGDGNDILDGGPSNDTLTGGLGADTFIVFYSTTGVNAYGLDTITDFHPWEGDKIDQNQKSKIYDYNFRAGVNVRALDSDDYFLYDTATGALYYDEDGSGAKAAVQFATLANRPNLSAADFVKYVPETAKPLVINGTPKNDILTGGTANDTINGLAGNDILYGGGGNDILYGGNGDDCLDGRLDANSPYKVADWNAGVALRSGADTMYGGYGNDYYFVDNTGDKVIEYAGQGYDRVYADINYTLTPNVEFLWLQGSAGISGTGNNLDNYMIGNSGANFLNGGAGNDTLVGQDGNDTLWGGNGADMLSGDGGIDILSGGAGDDWLRGGAGNDILGGGAGSDRFVFESVLTNGNDTITDFQSGSDRFILGGLGTLIGEMRQRGSLPAYRFEANNTGVAKDVNDRIIYNLKTGALYYDADGSGSGVAVQFATLSNKPANLKAGDFFAMAS